MKAEVTRAHPTGEIQFFYTAPVPSWKRKCATGTDPTVAEEDVDDAADVGTAERKSSSYKQQKKMSTYGDRCDNVRAEKIALAITKFLLGCALPFAIVDSVFFINIITALNSKPAVLTYTWHLHNKLLVRFNLIAVGLYLYFSMCSPGRHGPCPCRGISRSR